MIPAEVHRILIRDKLGKSWSADRIHLRAHCNVDGVAVNQAHAAANHGLRIVERLPGKAESRPQAVLMRRKHRAPRMTRRAEVNDAAASRGQSRVGNVEIEIGYVVVALIKPAEDLPTDAVRQQQAVVDAPRLR